MSDIGDLQEVVDNKCEDCGKPGATEWENHYAGPGHYFCAECRELCNQVEEEWCGNLVARLKNKPQRPA